MGFWIFMLVCVLLTPLTMMIMGLIYFKGGYPKKINYSSGYRTKLSMRNQETWSFAQKLYGKVWFIIGSIIVLPSVVPMLFVISSEADDINGIGCTGGYVVIVQMFIMILSIIPIESALKKKFPESASEKT